VCCSPSRLVWSEVLRYAVGPGSCISNSKEGNLGQSMGAGDVPKYYLPSARARAGVGGSMSVGQSLELGGCGSFCAPHTSAEPPSPPFYPRKVNLP
jgi:hypothetical protein